MDWIKVDAFEDPTIDAKQIRDILEKCNQRMNMSYFKYGPAAKNFGSGRVDALGSLDKCERKFQQTKNQDYLYDVINYAVFRLLYPMPGDFYRATDSSESAGYVGTPVNMERGDI